MEYATAQGLEMPKIGLGTMRLKGSVCQDVVSSALDQGYRHVDTARKYGNEEDVGIGLRRSSVPREDIILVTKLQPDELAPDDVATATESSLRRLDTDYVDALLIHWPNSQVPVDDTLDALIRLRDQGKTRFIGVGNFPSAMMADVAKTPGLIGDQVEYHPYLAQDKILEVIRAHELILTAYCPLGRGGTLLKDPDIADVASTHGRTVPQVVLRWLTQQDGVVAIPGTSNVDHVRENLDIFDFTLSDDEMRKLSTLSRGERVVDPPHAPEWDE